ncbi:MAG: AAA family ATPase [Bacteroidales bacterium]|jgi:ATP-dependent Clp protease ATP-binding subunit ClpC|nr:AAA family ATPase [Bacteroidales bacterium]
MKPLFTQEYVKILQYSREEAIRTGNNVLLPEHLFLGILRHENNIAAKLLEKLNININNIKSTLDDKLDFKTSLTFNQIDKLVFSTQTEMIIANSIIEAKNKGWKKTLIHSYHLLLSIFNSEFSNGVLTFALWKNKTPLIYDKLQEDILNFLITEKSLIESPAKINADYFYFLSFMTKILNHSIDIFDEFKDKDIKKKSKEIMKFIVEILKTSEEDINKFDLNFLSKDLEKILSGKDDNTFLDFFDDKLFPKNSDDDDFDYEDDEDDDLELLPKDDPFTKTKEHKSILKHYGTDITKLAKEHKIDAIAGRENEIDRLIYILGRKKKNNPVLIGESGIGKTAIAEGLALRIIKEKQNNNLANKRIINLNMASLVAGTMWRGQFEERLMKLIKELKDNPNVIVFFDEIHTMLGAGSSVGGLDASNILKPALARGEFQCIGTTTLSEYKKSIETDAALERRFQKIIVKEPSEAETLKILHSIKKSYEQYHSVKYTDKAIEACIKLSTRYITDRALPDKAIDILDEAGATANTKLQNNSPSTISELQKKINSLKRGKIAFAKKQEYEKASEVNDDMKVLEKELFSEQQKLKDNFIEVDENFIAEIVSTITNIPANKLATNEAEKLLKIKDVLAEAVIGQEFAIEEISNAIIRNRAGIRNPNRPIGSFIFLGTTGVGKTHLAKILSKYMFNSDDALIRIDMSEYIDKISFSRLIGAPPGYVGYQEGGMLTEKVRRTPYSIILLDEIEKAHPDIYNILLQILDEGQVTDSLGRKINFKNTILIMTSNIGTRQVAEFGKGIGFDTSANIANYDKNAQKLIENSLKNTFRPEFLNRIDEIIIFNSLSYENILKIIDLELEEIRVRIKEMGYDFRITDKVKKHIATSGFDQKYGARPLKRIIQKQIENKISEIILLGTLAKGNTICFDINEAKEIIYLIE